MLYTLSRQNQLTLATLNRRPAGDLHGAFGMLALLIAGQDKLWSSGPGTLLWVVLLGARSRIYRVWSEATAVTEEPVRGRRRARLPGFLGPRGGSVSLPSHNWPLN